MSLSSTRFGRRVVSATAASSECIRLSGSAIAQRIPTPAAQAIAITNAVVAQSHFDATVTEWLTENCASVPSMRAFTWRVARPRDTA